MKTENFSRSVQRTVLVLKSFSPSDLELTPAEISRRVRIPKTTTYRIIATLTKNGLLECNENTGKYRVGPELYFLGSLYLGTTDIVKAAEPVTKELNRLTSEAFNVSIFDNGHVVVVMKEESKSFFRFAVHIGSIIPAYASSMGKALLSDLTDEKIDSLYPDEKLRPVTKKTIVNKKELKKELEQIRKTGVSFSDGGTYDSLFGIASLIRDASGKGVAALSINLPTFKIDLVNKEKLATLVKMGANLISYRLGYQNMVNPVRNIRQIISWWEQDQLGSESETLKLRIR